MALTTGTWYYNCHVQDFLHCIIFMILKLYLTWRPSIRFALLYVRKAIMKMAICATCDEFIMASRVVMCVQLSRAEYLKTHNVNNESHHGTWWVLTFASAAYPGQAGAIYKQEFILQLTKVILLREWIFQCHGILLLYVLSTNHACMHVCMHELVLKIRIYPFNANTIVSSKCRH